MNLCNVSFYMSNLSISKLNILFALIIRSGVISSMKFMNALLHLKIYRVDPHLDSTNKCKFSKVTSLLTSTKDIDLLIVGFLVNQRKDVIMKSNTTRGLSPHTSICPCTSSPHPLRSFYTSPP